MSIVENEALRLFVLGVEACSKGLPCMLDGNFEYGYAMQYEFEQILTAKSKG